jgi:hypothetical protein
VLFNGLLKYLVAFFLVTIYAPAVLAAANDLSLPSNIIGHTMNLTNPSPIKTSVRNSSECFPGYFANNKIVSTAMEGKDLAFGSMNECFEETAVITLRKEGDEIMWGLAPSLGKFSLNPIDDIKNLQVLLQYRF